MKGSSTGKASPKPSAADKALARKRAVKTAKKGPPGAGGTVVPKATKPPVPGSITPAMREGSKANIRKAAEANRATQRSAASKSAAASKKVAASRAIRTAKKGRRGFGL